MVESRREALTIGGDTRRAHILPASACIAAATRRMRNVDGWQSVASWENIRFDSALPTAWQPAPHVKDFRSPRTGAARS